MASKINAAIESKYRDKKIEMEVTAYAVRENPALAMTIEPTWLSSAFLGNILKLIRSVKTTLSRAALQRELKRRNLVNGSEKTYKNIVSDLFEVEVDKISDKALDLMAEDLLEMSESRKILYGLQTIVSGVAKDDFDLDNVKTELRELGKPVRLKDDMTAGEYLDGYETRLEIIKKKAELRDSGEDIGIGTGINAFDRLCGGTMPGEFGVVGGRTGIGKTACLLSFLKNAWESGKNCLFVSGEMLKTDIQFRLDSMISGIPAMDFRKGSVSNKQHSLWKKTIATERKTRANYLEIVNLHKGFNMETICDEAMRVQDEHKSPVDMVCIDYINIVSSAANDRYRSSHAWDSQADVVWEMKEFFETFNGGICGWTAGQLKDEALTTDVLTLGDFKYARAISETAPIVLGLVSTHRDEVEHLMELQVLKMRQAKLPEHFIVLKPNMECMRIHEDVIGARDLLLLDEEVVPKRLRKRKRGG